MDAGARLVPDGGRGGDERAERVRPRGFTAGGRGGRGQGGPAADAAAADDADAEEIVERRVATRRARRTRRRRGEIAEHVGDPAGICRGPAGGRGDGRGAKGAARWERCDRPGARKCVFWNTVLFFKSAVFF